MKITQEKHPVLSNNTNGETQSFKIDPEDGFIFNVLRKSMYSNPLKIVVQEVMSNARDAMRESNKTNIPVEVIINTRDSYFVVKDQGPGITPQRMSEIVLWYGRSTKRDDNKQVGGWGLGFKSPYALADAFLITTRVNNTQYEYCAFIDESTKGALKLLNQRPMTNNEINGTEIRVPIPIDKIHQVEPYVREIAQWWNPTVTILGRPVIPHIKPLFSGNGWVILDPKDLNRMDRKPLCICDGIPFYGTIPTSYDIKVPYSVIPVFKTGEIQLPANRENVHWCDLTVNGFKEKIANFYKEYKVHLEKDLNGLNTWAEKLLYLHNVVDVFKDEKIINDLKYNNPIKFKTPDRYYDKTTNLYSFKYTPYYHEETINVNYSVESVVISTFYYDTITTSKSTKQNLADDLKNGKAYVIFNDLIDETAKEMIANLQDFEKRWATYQDRLKDYEQKKRKSRPSRPSCKEIGPYCGVATKDIREKLLEYIKQETLSTIRVYIVSAPHDDIPINYNAKLSDVKNLVLTKDVKPKEVKPSVPEYIEFFKGHYRSERISDFKNSNTVVLKFPTKKQLLRTKAGHPTDIKQIKWALKNLDLHFVLMTELEFKKIAKYETANNIKLPIIDFEDFIVEFLKQNPGLKPSNVEDYNAFIISNISDGFRRILTQYAKADIVQRIEKLKPITHSKELIWNNKKIKYEQHTSLLNSLTSLKSHSKNLQSELVKLQPVEYNVSVAQREIEAIKDAYPLLKSCYITTQNQKDVVHYIQLINNS